MHVCALAVRIRDGITWQYHNAASANWPCTCHACTLSARARGYSQPARGVLVLSMRAALRTVWWRAAHAVHCTAPPRVHLQLQGAAPFAAQVPRARAQCCNCKPCHAARSGRLCWLRYVTQARGQLLVCFTPEATKKNGNGCSCAGALARGHGIVSGGI